LVCRHARFFEIVDPIVGCMVNQSRFLAEIAEPSPPINVQALSYAIAALGALTSAEYSSARDECYNQARELLDLCERQDSGRMLVSINTLQTCVLLALYEFKSPNFVRLWITLGRAIRLCRMMGLDTLDAGTSNTLPGPFELPPATSPAEMEERRRTFWILYIFDVSAATRSPAARPAFDAGQVPVRLPGTGDIAKTVHDSEMPLLLNIETLAPSVSLPPLAGTVFTGWLYRRLLEHVHQSKQSSSSYPFWVTHYSLDRLLIDCRARACTDPEQPVIKEDRALYLTMQSNLGAVEMLLHGTALSKAETDPHLPVVLRTEAATRCAAAAARMHDVIMQAKLLDPTEMESHRQSGEFFVWPITSAVTILRTQLRNPRAKELEPAKGYADTIQVLVDALRELVPTQDLIPDGLLAEDQEDMSGRRSSDDVGGSDAGSHESRYRRSHSM
jgi:hypothetical protein